MTDESMTDVYRRLALSFEPDLEERSAMVGKDARLFVVLNERGLRVTSSTSLGAWTAALGACQRRAAWRAAKAKRKLEKGSTFEPIGSRSGRPSLYLEDDQPDGAA